MAVPTREEFQQYIELTDLCSEPILSRLPSRWDGVPLDENYVGELLRADEEFWSAAFDTIQNHPVHDWMVNSWRSRGAWNALEGRRQCEHESEYDPFAEARRIVADCMAKREASHLLHAPGTDRKQIAERLEAANSESGQRKRLHRRLESIGEYNRFRVLRGVARCYLGYFYTDAFSKYSSEAASMEAAQQLLAAIRTAQDQSMWEAAGVRVGCRVRRHTIDDLERVAAEGRKPPISRHDSTARERTLAYELWSVIRTRSRFDKANKTQAIFNFLQFEGIENPPASERAVQRWVKAWSDEGVMPNPSLLLDRIGD